MVPSTASMLTIIGKTYLLHREKKDKREKEKGRSRCPKKTTTKKAWAVSNIFPIHIKFCPAHRKKKVFAEMSLTKLSLDGNDSCPGRVWLL